MEGRREEYLSNKGRVHAMFERRAMGFFQLYNATLMKEMETISKGKVKDKMKVGFFIRVFLNI